MMGTPTPFGNDPNPQGGEEKQHPLGHRQIVL